MWESYVLNLIKDYFGLSSSAVITTIGVFIIRYINNHFTKTKIEHGKKIALIVVNAVEEFAKVTGIKGNAKYEEALRRAKELAEKKLHLSDEQWNSLIHDALGELKLIWNQSTGK